MSDPNFIKTIADEIKDHVMMSLKENFNSSNLAGDQPNGSSGEYKDPF